LGSVGRAPRLSAGGVVKLPKASAPRPVREVRHASHAVRRARPATGRSFWGRLFG